MGEDAQGKLAPLSLMATRPRRRAEAALMLAEAALDVPTLATKNAGKVLVQGPPVGRLRPGPCSG